MKAHIVIACALVAVAAPVGAAPLEKWGATWSEVTGLRWGKVEKYRDMAVIKQVDGRHETSRIVKAEPGKHRIVVQSPMRKGFSGSDVTVEIDLEPCKRYYINTQFESGTGTDWHPVVANVEIVPGCKVPATTKPKS